MAPLGLERVARFCVFVDVAEDRRYTDHTFAWKLDEPCAVRLPAFAVTALGNEAALENSNTQCYS